MKKISIILIIFILASCAKEEHLKQFKLVNQLSFGTSTGSFNSISGILTDTIKITKSTTWAKELNFVNISGLKTIKVTNELGSIIQELPIEKGKLNYALSIPGIIAGNTSFRVLITEISGNVQTIIVNIHGFSNWLPVASMVKDDANKRLDFTGSIDQDKRFGGLVDEYRVSVNGNLRKQDETPYFPLTVNNGFTIGQSYIIKIEAIDNDGAVSAAVEQNVTIN